jgi:hypothetical protein
VLILDFVEGEHRLQALLDRLLDVEAEHIVGHIVVVEQAIEDRLVSLGLPYKQQRQLVRLRTRQ